MGKKKAGGKKKKDDDDDWSVPARLAFVHALEE